MLKKNCVHHCSNYVKFGVVNCENCCKQILSYLNSFGYYERYYEKKV